MWNKEQRCGNNWYKLKTIVFSLTVLEKNPQIKKLCNTKSKFVRYWSLKLWDICWQKSKRIINAVKSTNLCMKNCVTTFQHLKTRDQTEMLIFPRYHTYLLICYAIDLTVWWYSEKCTDNWLVSQKDQWFRTARLVQQNNDCVMCFYILWYKNLKHLKKINMTNLWF